jgi:hypothetical protein
MSAPSYEQLVKENEELKAKLQKSASGGVLAKPLTPQAAIEAMESDWSSQMLSVVVIGASGDLAK